MTAKTVYRDRVTGATFVVVGEDAEKRMDALANWVKQ